MCIYNPSTRVAEAGRFLDLDGNQLTRSMYTRRRHVTQKGGTLMPSGCQVLAVIVLKELT